MKEKKDEENIILAKDMKDDVMKELLKEFYYTNYWQALKKFITYLTIDSNSALRIIDPVKEPTRIAKIQGILQFAFDLERQLDVLTKKSDEDEEESDIKNS